ncbi:hypothetical protein TNIN_45691 [Trichonephila inaurata madagascariensis]|uniref:Uncharacterized protein n=1 Tax=Trichonephila inaurata madagascariensis TaxID=2747483 RepID=A0A8X7CP71_9ARAC|nr:hypothetical protein TNIN_45691 [Trichonephila inaurata madagascariensis]
MHTAPLPLNPSALSEVREEKLGRNLGQYDLRPGEHSTSPTCRPTDSCQKKAGLNLNLGDRRSSNQRTTTRWEGGIMQEVSKSVGREISVWEVRKACLPNGRATRLLLED